VAAAAVITRLVEPLSEHALASLDFHGPEFA
jgi:hypothetical protein